MHRTFAAKITLVIAAWFYMPACNSQPLPELRPQLSQPASALTLTGAVRIAEKQYPQLLQIQAEAAAAKANVRLQKVREYMPRTPLMYETVVGSHNRLTQTIFGSEVLPTTPGPGPDTERPTRHAEQASHHP